MSPLSWRRHAQRSRPLLRRQIPILSRYRLRIGVCTWAVSKAGSRLHNGLDVLVVRDKALNANALEPAVRNMLSHVRDLGAR